MWHSRHHRNCNYRPRIRNQNRTRRLLRNRVRYVDRLDVVNRDSVHPITHLQGDKLASMSQGRDLGTVEIEAGTEASSHTKTKSSRPEQQVIEH